jgi:hypothetical protein
VNQYLGYGTVAEAQAHPGLRWRTPVLLIALALAAVPTVIYLAGLGLHSNAPGTCTDWYGCSHSARQQWAWEVGSVASRGIAVAAFIAAVAYLAPWLGARAKVRKVASIVALCVLVPLIGLFGLLVVAIWRNECSADSFLCFGGPEDALVVGVPAVVTAMACLVLAFGLARTRAGQITSTVTITGLAALILAAVAGLIGETILTGVATTLFSL